MDKIRVGVLGATGAVGQRFVQLLEGHPWFQLASLTGSTRNIGKSYGEACRWVLSERMPKEAAGMPILESRPDALDALLLFSALPAAEALEIEPLFSQAGRTVCSNASAFRAEPDVPTIMPEVNPEHTSLIEIQRRRRGWMGAIVTNPNCTSAGITVVLNALNRQFEVRDAFAVSFQAISGAGYPGVASLDINENVIPFVGGEEEKVEWEPRKMLGTIRGEAVEPAEIRISAHTNRVPITDGHLVCLSVGLDAKPSMAELEASLEQFILCPEESLGLPSSPNPVIRLYRQEDRPQPRLDRMDGGGMTTGVGRLRPDPILDFKMVVLSHNTIRGAAGGSIYNAELLHKQGWI